MNVHRGSERIHIKQNQAPVSHAPTGAAAHRSFVTHEIMTPRSSDRTPARSAGMCALPPIFSLTQRDVIGGFSLSQLAQGSGAWALVSGARGLAHPGSMHRPLIRAGVMRTYTSRAPPAHGSRCVLSSRRFTSRSSVTVCA